MDDPQVTITVMDRAQFSARLEAEGRAYQVALDNMKKPNFTHQDRLALAAYLHAKEAVSTKEGRDKILEKVGLGEGCAANARLAVQATSIPGGVMDCGVWYKATENDGVLRLKERMLINGAKELFEKTNSRNGLHVPVELMDNSAFQKGDAIDISIKIRASSAQGSRVMPTAEEQEKLVREAILLLKQSIKRDDDKGRPMAANPAFDAMLERGTSQELNALASLPFAAANKLRSV